jgi:predicted nucleic-acid-binding Zn-ribbon protein
MNFKPCPRCKNTGNEAFIDPNGDLQKSLNVVYNGKLKLRYVECTDCHYLGPFDKEWEDTVTAWNNLKR